MNRLNRLLAATVFAVTMCGVTPIHADILYGGNVLYVGQTLDSSCCSLGWNFGSYWFGSSYYLRWTSSHPWSSLTQQNGAIDVNGFANMQTDGNFVLYTGFGTPRWASDTDGNPGAFLNAQDDGNLVVYSSTSVPLWSVY